MEALVLNSYQKGSILILPFTTSMCAYLLLYILFFGILYPGFQAFLSQYTAIALQLQTRVTHTTLRQLLWNRVNFSVPQLTCGFRKKYQGVANNDI